MRTIPREPSTVIFIPSLITDVPIMVPTTQGMRYSRATMAQCERIPPVSATTALAVLNSGVHGGSVISHTRTSPACSFEASSSERTTLAVAVTVPGEAATPLMMLGSVLGSTGRPKKRTITSTTGSPEGGGGGPLNGGGTTRAK